MLLAAGIEVGVKEKSELIERVYVVLGVRIVAYGMSRASESRVSPWIEVVEIEEVEAKNVVGHAFYEHVLVRIFSIDA